MAETKAYWQKREEKWMKSNVKKDIDFNKRLEAIYQSTYKDINDKINQFYMSYAKHENITLNEARQRVKAHDVDAFASAAKKMVKNKDFSDEANAQLKLYNTTMKVNRLEMLKSQIGQSIVDGGVQLEKEIKTNLSKGYVDEVTRQAGILGQDRDDDVLGRASSVVNASFQGAKWSSRLWISNLELQSQIGVQLSRAMVGGLNPRTIAKDLMPLVKDTVANKRFMAERIAVTEMARVQDDAQMASFRKYGIKDVMWIAEPGACKVCRDIASYNNGIYPIDDVPYIPAHPSCRCAKVAYVKRGTIKPLSEMQPDVKPSDEGKTGKVSKSNLPKIAKFNTKTVSEKQVRSNGEAIFNDVFTESRTAAIKLVKDSEKELQNRIKLYNARTPQEGDTYAVLIKAQKDLGKAQNNLQKQLIKDVNSELKKHRSVGLAKGDSQAFNGYSVKTNISKINKVISNLPTDWGNASKDHVMFTKSAKRGYYSDGNGALVISGKGADALETAFHEMGHRMEHILPDIRRVEHEFYVRRTKGEELEQMSKITGNSNYSSTETTRIDNFLNPYMGKDYGNTDESYYELLSMGMEGLYTGSIDMEKDKDFATFILGLITTM